MPKPLIRFNCESEFQQYCERVKLDLDTCHPVQVIETRRAFLAGVAQMLVFLRDGISQLSEDECVAELERINKQVQTFWERQAAVRTAERK